MRGKKEVMAYGAGFLALACCTAIAWFLPEAYGIWQDKRQIGKVTLSARSSIEFMDGDVLDQIRRWRSIATQIDQGYEVFWEEAETADSMLAIDYDGYRAACVEEIGRWCDSGLLPYEKEKLNLIEYGAQTKLTYIGTEVVPLVIFSFYADSPLFGEYLYTVMDLETKKLYYVSAFGTEVGRYMAEQMGYETQRRLHLALAYDKEAELGTPDLSGIDFASVCGADQCSANASKGSLDLEAELTIDDFTIAAQRYVVARPDSGSYGLAVMYGPMQQPDLFSQCLFPGEWEVYGMDYYPYQEIRIFPEEWLEYMKTGVERINGQTRFISEF